MCIRIKGAAAAGLRSLRILMKNCLLYATISDQLFVRSPNRHFLSFSASTGQKYFKLCKDIINSYLILPVSFFLKVEVMNIGI
jgi:hypothetical protein